MRRAMRQFKHLGFERLMLHDLAAIVANNLHEAYPELRANIKSIQSTIRQEEQRFDTVLSASLPKLEELLDRASSTGSPVSGDEAFKLYDTFGLPLDFIEDMAAERKLAFDRASFDAAMEGQREKARAKSAFDGKKADDYAFASPESADRLRAAKETFEGYTTTTVKAARILALFDDKKQQVTELATGQSGVIALDRTPFYLEAGGQVSDVGTLQNEAGTTIASVDGRRPAGRRAPTRPSRDRRRGAARRGPAGRGRGRRDHPGRHPPEPHGHSPAPCRPAPGARPARQAGGLARCAGSPAVRLHALLRRRAGGAGRDRGDRQRADPAQHRRLDRGARHGRGHQVRRDGAVRREVRRPGPRRLDSGLQHRAVRRHAHEGDGRHRAVHHHRRERSGGRRAGASRRRPAPARCTICRRIARRSRRSCQR